MRGRPKKIAEEIKLPEPLKVITTYPVPETKEDYLNIHKCLKDTGVNSIGDLEVKAQRL